MEQVKFEGKHILGQNKKNGKNYPTGELDLDEVHTNASGPKVNV